MATFLGKFSFGSTNPGTQVFLAAFRTRDGYFPGMSAAASGPSTACILYGVTGGTTIQLLNEGSWMYLSLNTGLGWIEFAAEQSQAAVFTLAGSGGQQTWTVMSATVGYTVDSPPLLTINENPNTTFAPQQVTPPLSAIVQSKNGAHLDLSAVDLSGQNLAGIDFTGTDFTGANLTNTIFDNCPMTNAHFDGATLAKTSFNGATLDGATFTGQQTVVSQVQWGQPKSAVGIQFTGCQGQGTQIGASGAVIDCTGAGLGSANFSGANLSKLNFSGCQAAGVILSEGCNCTSTVFDGATLTGAVATRGNFNGASLQRVSAGGAVFVSTDLTGANLTQGQFGSKAFLFPIPESLVSDLDTHAFVTTGIISAFSARGIRLAPEASITVLNSGTSWRITDPVAGRFSIINAPDQSALDVFRIGAVAPAVFTGAKMVNTVATSAGFSSADFTGAAWTGGSATGAHADLETAVLADAYMVETDFTQAQIFGTSFVNSVLIQTKLQGSTIGPGEDGQPTNFSGAQLQGTQFAGSNLDGVLLGGAAVALAQGVPLFVMPLSYQSDLTSQGLPTVAKYFAQQGYPLGASASIASAQAWSIDNSSDQQPNATKSFLVWNKSQNLGVFDGSTNLFLFNLNENMVPFLKNPPPQVLVRAFARNRCDLAATAVISPANFWLITNSQDAPGPVVYQSIKIFAQTDGLHVYGATTLWLADYPNAGAVAFGSTLGIQSALNPQSICPNGYPRAAFDNGLFTWEQMMTVGKGSG